MADQGTGTDDIIDLTAPRPTADYSAWRDRLRAKAERNKSLFEPAPEATTDDASTGASGYWRAEQVYADSERVREEQAELLAVLDLRDTAGPRDIALAYRRLAKVHHPDRWAEADSETRRYHEDRMRTVNEAYQALRAAQRV